MVLKLLNEDNLLKNSMKKQYEHLARFLRKSWLEFLIRAEYCPYI